MSITTFLSLPLVVTSQLSPVPPSSAADLLPVYPAQQLEVKSQPKSPPPSIDDRKSLLHISKLPVETEIVTTNDSIGSGPSKLPDGTPVVNDYGSTFSLGEQHIQGGKTEPRTVTGYNFQANSDAYTPTSPSNPFSQRAGANTDSSSITVFTGEIKRSNNSTSYNGVNLTAIGTNPVAREVQRSFHTGLNSFGLDTNQPPPLFNKGNGPTGDCCQSQQVNTDKYSDQEPFRD